METYKVYYKDVFLGTLLVNEEYRYSYSPDFEGVEKVKDHACLLKVMENGTNGEFIEPIPFFQERLRYMKLWKLDVIGYHTDYFVIKKVKE